MANQQPTYRAFTVVKREGQDDFWLNIGAAFMHQDGDGFNIVLQALPMDGKIVLRLPKDDKTGDAAGTQGSVEGSRSDKNKSGSQRR